MIMKRKTQQGAVLITTLILLFVLTLAVTTNMNNTLIESKVVANQRDRLVAMESAESALREAEAWLESQETEPTSSADGATPVWSTDAPNNGESASEWWFVKDEAWWQQNSQQLQSSEFNRNQKPPMYVVESYDYIQDSLVSGQQKDERGRNFYRITSKGTGGTDTARVLLQSTFTKRF